MGCQLEPISLLTVDYELSTALAALQIASAKSRLAAIYRGDRPPDFAGCAPHTGADFERLKSKGKQREVQFRLRDATLDRLTKSGIVSKTEFDVEPGTYLLRQIVREGATARVTALNRIVEIP